MQLRIHEVAGLMQVSERTVRRWIKDDGLPIDRVLGDDSVNRLEFFEWALSHGIDGAIAILPEHSIENLGHEPLAKAIEAGEVLCGLEAADRESALRCVAQSLRLPCDLDRQTVITLFLSQAFSDATNLGDGIVVPHSRRPFILPLRTPRVTACHFERAVALGPAGLNEARTLFVIVAPTVRNHQFLLARLTQLLRDTGFRSLVGEEAGSEELAQFVRQYANGTNGTAHGEVANAIGLAAIP